MKKTKYINYIFTFINSKGESKTVNFRIENYTLEMIKKLSEEERQKYLIDYYHDYLKLQNRRRKETSIDSFYGDGEELQIADDNDIIKKSFKSHFIEDIFDYLSDEDSTILKMRFFEGLTLIQIAEKLSINERTVRRKLKSIIENLRENFKDFAEFL